MYGNPATHRKPLKYAPHTNLGYNRNNRRISETIDKRITTSMIFGIVDFLEELKNIQEVFRNIAKDVPT